jgi:hypothetical protein
MTRLDDLRLTSQELGSNAAQQSQSRIIYEVPDKTPWAVGLQALSGRLALQVVGGHSPKKVNAMPMDILLKRSAILEWGLNEEVEVIFLGLKYHDGTPIHTLIIQIPEEGSWLARENVHPESQGMHVEIDEHAFYGGVVDFKYDEVEGCFRLTLVPEMHKEINVLQIELPRPLSAEQQQLVEKLVSSYNSSLASERLKG